MLQELHLDSVASRVKKAENCTLEVFFSYKTHKSNFPLWVIVSEKGSWQAAVGNFLRDHLTILKTEDSCLIRSSLQVAEDLKKGLASSTSATFGISIGVEDFYYSIPHKELFNAVRVVIEQMRELPFQKVKYKHRQLFCPFRTLPSVNCHQLRESVLHTKIWNLHWVICRACSFRYFLSCIDKGMRSSLPHLHIYRYVDGYLV